MRKDIRSVAGYSLLFVASAAVTTTWLHARRVDPGISTLFTAGARPSPEAAAARAASRPSFEAAPEARPSSLDAQASLPAGGDEVDLASDEAPSQERARKVEEAKVQQLANVSLSSGDTESIISAVNGMSTVPTAESLYALSQLAGSPGNIRVRVAAVDTLRTLGSSGDGDGRIRQTLQQLTQAEDEMVSRRARDAIREIESILVE